MSRHPITFAAGFVVTALLLLVPVSAHHPFGAEYDWKKPTTFTATVTKVEWMNPHTYIYVNGKPDGAAAGEWRLELGSIGALSKFGWTKETAKIGEKVTVDGWLAKDGSQHVNAKSVTFADGRDLFAASSFFDVSSYVASTSAGHQP